MEQSRFRVVFEKVAEAAISGEPSSPEAPPLIPAELAEISELRRLSVELAEPEPQSYTLT